MHWLWRQLVDGVTYWVLPFIGFILPTRLAVAWARLLCRRNWLFRAQVRASLANARRVQDIDDERDWAYRFRMVQFIEAVDIWHATFSSDRRIARALVTQPAQWPLCDAIVMLGLHLGTGTLFLRCLAAAGFVPRIVYRELDRQWFRAKPILWWYRNWRIRYMIRVCQGGAIRVPGGRDLLDASFGEPGVGLVLVPDAPAEGRRGDRLHYRGHSMPVNARGLEMLVSHGALSAFFSAWWNDETGRRVIEIAPPRVLEDIDSALEAVNAHLVDMLERQPVQWHLWSTAEPVLRDDR